MLSPRVQLNLQNAKNYFREHLCGGDYYSAEQKISGEWFGLGAEKLQLKGSIKEEPFLALCEGLHPTNGEWLSQRKNTVRMENGKWVANRRIFYDFTISPPKSISIVGLYQDVRIVELHHRAIQTAMQEFEKYAQTRVRKGGKDSERITGNFIGAAFQHDTSRELDPHLHTHCVIMNATFDPVENSWKAIEASCMYRAQKLAENLYYHELAKGLTGLGYELENTPLGPEIKGVPPALLQTFSKRHEQINEQAQTRIVQEGVPQNVKDLREQVAHDGRRPKSRDATAERLRPFWSDQMTAEERTALNQLLTVKPREIPRAEVKGIVTWADEHLFERRSVIHDYELLSTALAYARGQDLTILDLRAAIEARAYVREEGSFKLTSREVLQCEKEIVFAAQDGRRRHAPFHAQYDGDPRLSGEQRAALKQILGSRDLITLFRGAAGTGKSFALKEVRQGLVLAGRQAVVLAPQSQQVRDLEKEGLPAQTLAHLLTTKQLPRHAVVILDEAGQVGGRQLRELIRLVQARDARLILSGDTRQHGAVTASDALRAIEQYGEITPAEIRTIRRQDPRRATSVSERAFIRQYRAAVKAAASGNTLKSFELLDQLGCVRELPIEARRETLAAEYITAIGKKESAVIVAQTLNEVRAVNDTVRAKLKESGKLADGLRLATYQVVDATSAQKRDPRFFESGHHMYFLQNYGRYKKADVCEVLGATRKGVILLKDGRRSTISFRYAQRFSVVKETPLEIAPGDRLLLKFNGKSKEGLPFSNGELVTVSRVLHDGGVVVEGDRGVCKTLSPTQRLFTHGYAITSYASQGKTVDNVLFADSACGVATNQNQWYVAISRGRKRVSIFTSDKTELRANIQQLGARELALELKTLPVAEPSVPVTNPECAETISADLQRRYTATREAPERYATHKNETKIHL